VEIEVSREVPPATFTESATTSPSSSSRVARSYVPENKDSYFEVRTVRLDPVLRSDRYTVQFMNLTGTEIRLEVNGQVLQLKAGARQLMDLDREFTWRVEDRPAEVGRLVSRDEGVVIAIRR
jgi:hypothetical protein